VEKRAIIQGGKMKEYIIYVCYRIKKINEIKAIIDTSEMEAFTDIEKAKGFMREHFGKFMLNLEKCDEALYKQLKQQEREE
jgi:hypothetical protein